MDTEHDSQAFINRRNSGGNQPQSLPGQLTVKPDDGDEQKLDLAWLLGVVRRRLPIMAGVAIVLTAISGSTIVLKSKSIVPEYEGSFRILVEPVTAEDRLAKQFLSSQTNNADIQKIEVEKSSLLDYETQIRVLLSSKLMEPVIKDMQKKYPDINYNSMITKLLIFRVNYEKDGTQYGTKILEVSYRDKNPEKVNFILDKLSQTYLRYSKQERLSSLKQGLDFLNQQLPQLRGQVDTLQGQLQKLRQQYNVSDPEQADTMLFQQALALEKDRLDTQVQLAETRAFYATLQKQLREGNPTGVLATDSKTYETLIGKLQGLETEIASMSPQFREDSPPIQVLRERQQNIQNLLRQQAEGILKKVAGQLEGLENRYQTIAQTERQVKQKLQQLPDVSRQYGDLQRKLEVATQNLKEFLAKREALRLDAAQQEVPWELIENPQLRVDEEGNLLSVATKQTKKQLAIAIVLSALLSIGLGFLIEALNTVFHTPEDVKGETKLPILGVIPFAKELKKLPKKQKEFASLPEVGSLNESLGGNLVNNGNGRASLNFYTDSPFLEAFRSLYTNIRLISANRPITSLAVSSAVPGDGKSTVAINLALAAAAIGQRVLLVDADLRRPSLHTRLNLPNVRGLGDVIATDLSINDAIGRSPSDKNLFVLTAGQNSSDPIKLLSSDKMQYLIEQFQARFDLVIYDSPPLVGLADSNILAANTDGTVLVVGIDKTDRTMLMKALDGLKISGGSVLGIVANGLKGYTAPAYPSYSRTGKN
ncbi:MULTISPECIES: GumC family protein [Cyanophyceae]|uniref:GumC family protein n=1 Tax=Cyanophyceae TaxID=3028117 RepID=UPI001687FB1F|nr:polysaccharide biosynthesis tyrosine autokinase [Trichocoleus sp. FACHB-69]MBD1933093.1 polysaccharide biosynthesis tyrosine autokinase [Trichocoleus sp. FACHB-69]